MSSARLRTTQRIRTTDDEEATSSLVERPVSSDVERGRSVKITGYRIFNTFLTITFITIKAVCSLKSDINPTLSSVSDWTLGGFVALIMWWVGCFETVEPPILPWFLHHDYGVDIARGVRYIFGARSHLQSSTSPATSSPVQFDIELMPATSGNSSSSTTRVTSEAYLPPSYETVTHLLQQEPESNSLDNRLDDESHADCTAAVIPSPPVPENPTFRPEPPSTLAALHDPQSQPEDELSSSISEIPAEPAVDEGLHSPGSLESSGSPGSPHIESRPSYSGCFTTTENQTTDFGDGPSTEPLRPCDPITSPLPCDVSPSLSQDPTGDRLLEGTSLSIIEIQTKSDDVEPAVELYSPLATSTPRRQTHLKLISGDEAYSTAIKRSEDSALRQRAVSMLPDNQVPREKTAMGSKWVFDQDQKYWLYLHNNCLRPQHILCQKVHAGGQGGKPWVTTLTINGVPYTSGSWRTKEKSQNHAAFFALAGLRALPSQDEMANQTDGRTEYVHSLHNYVRNLSRSGRPISWAKLEAPVGDSPATGDWCAMVLVNGRFFTYGPCNGKGAKHHAKEGAARKALMYFEQLPRDQHLFDGF